MQNKNNIVKTDWEEFWQEYRNIIPKSEEDLFFQVGKTIQGKPISYDMLSITILRTKKLLSLDKNDILLELCCGNGLVTFELAFLVKAITALDFSSHLIDAAKKYKQSDNIMYFYGDVKESLTNFLNGSTKYTKILMGVALAYFYPDELRTILANIINHNDGTNFQALFTDVPNKELIRNYYNTPERWETYCSNQSIPGHANDGIGRWWLTSELDEIASSLGLKVKIYNQPVELSNYRFDVLFTNLK
jgi:SAM-dependent methyltransferase